METPNLLQVGGGKISSYKGHIVGGIISFVLLIGGWLYFLDTKFSLPNILIMLGIVILFALFPDVDTNSKGQYIFYGMILIGDIFFLAINWLSGTSPHRGKTQGMDSYHLGDGRCTPSTDHSSLLCAWPRLEGIYAILSCRCFRLLFSPTS